MSEEMVLEEVTEEVPEETAPAVEEVPEVEEIPEVPPEEEEAPVEFEEFPEGTEVIENDEITDEQAETLMEELKSGRRYFEVPGVGRLYIRTPTVEESQEATFVYAKIFNKAILNGLESSDELEKHFIKKGLIDDERDPKSKINKNRTELTKQEALLNKYEPNNKSKQVKKVARTVADLRNDILEEVMHKRNLLSNSADARAEDIKNGFLISRTIYKAESEERVWETYEDYLQENNGILVNFCLLEYTTFSYGLASNYMFEFPEVKFLEDENEEV